MRKFDEYLKKGAVKIRKKNVARIRSLLEEANKRLRFFNKVPISDDSANYIIENLYDVIRELIEAKMLLEGYKSYSHGATVSYLEKLGFSLAEVEFMGGKGEETSYNEVCSGNTGYAEVVHLKFDSKKISYEKLLKIFFTSHDPTQFHKQGPDIGSQYRSVIFYYNLNQRKLAEKIKAEYQNKIKKEIVTEVVEAPKFVRAEEYHQKYFEKHPLVCKVMNIFGG